MAVKVGATVQVTGECVAPEFHSWWLVDQDEKGVRVESLLRNVISVKLGSPLPVDLGKSYSV